MKLSVASFITIYSVCFKQEAVYHITALKKLLHLEHLGIDFNSPTASKEWKYWYSTFINFIDWWGENAADKLWHLNYVSYSIYEYIKECTSFDSAISTLENCYVKTPN